LKEGTMATQFDPKASPVFPYFFAPYEHLGTINDKTKIPFAYVHLACTCEHQRKATKSHMHWTLTGELWEVHVHPKRKQPKTVQDKCERRGA